MKHRYATRVILIAILLAASVWALWSSPTNKKAGSSKESMDNCSELKESPGTVGWENLPRQFFSSF